MILVILARVQRILTPTGAFFELIKYILVNLIQITSLLIFEHLRKIALQLPITPAFHS